MIVVLELIGTRSQRGIKISQIILKSLLNLICYDELNQSWNKAKRL